MPFKETQTLPTCPAARIFFHGLLFFGLDEGDGKSCRIGIHRSSPDHDLSLEVRIKKPHTPDFVIMRHLGPLNFLGLESGNAGDRSQPGLRIRVNPPNDEADAGVSKFVAAARFNRAPNSASDPQDSRWGLDLSAIHNTQITFDTFDENCINPGILVTDGVLHTALKSVDSLIIEKVSLKTGARENFFPVAALMGINIYLKPDQNLVLDFVKDGLVKELSLPNPGEPPQVTYEIYIDNNPTFIDDTSHSDFREFYKAFKQDQLPSEQFDLDFTHPANPVRSTALKFQDSGADLGTPTIPCMPGGL